MSHNARSSDVFNTRYSLIIKMHHNKYHWMRMVQAIIQRLQIELAIGELVPFQNHAGLQGWIQTGRPYPTFHGIHKPSTCGFDFTDCGMLGGSRPSPVNRHGFEIAGSAGARLAPIMGPAPAGQPLGGWRTAPRMRETAVRGIRDVPRAPERRAAATPPPASAARPASSPPPQKVFPKLSLHRRPSSRIVPLRTGA